MGALLLTRLLGLALGVAVVAAAPVKARQPSRKQEHPLVRPVCGALASCTAEAFTMPIDAAKVRMQLSTDASASFIGTLLSIIQQDGSSALFRGLKPALLRQASYQGIKMFLYEPIRDAVLKATSKDGSDQAQPKLWQMIIAGGLAGAIGTYITSPTDLVKIRMQSGVQYDGVIDAFVSIAATSGLLSLWDGWAPNVQRSFIVNAAELATYDYFKQLLLRTKFVSEGLLLHTLASSLAGLVAALASTPVDRAKTLLMTDRQAHGSVFTCLLKIARESGLSGLYQGFLATWMRLGPWACLFFICFEQFRAAAERIAHRGDEAAAKAQ